MTKKYAIIGAGPAGLTAAYELTKAGKSVDVYEADNEVGGMAKTIDLWGQLVDLGPHRFFSNDSRVNTLWLELAGSEYVMVKRLTRIFYKDTFFDYPLKPFNALNGLGFSESFACILSYLSSKAFPPKDTSKFDGWVIKRFGKRLFNIFFKSYSEKLWGIKCDELDSDFAAQRIKKLSLYEAIKSAFIGNKNTDHKTLVDEFAYPKNGAGQIYKNMSKRIISSKNSIFFNSPVKSVSPICKENLNPIIETIEGKKIEYDHVISTMPITRLVNQMNAPLDVKNHANALKFRNTILVYLKIKGESPFPDQWIYVHNDKLKTGRITNFKNWTPTINKNQKDTILCLEYWCYDNDKVWNEDNKEIINTAIQDIYKSNLVKDGSIEDGKVLRIPKCYPVYASGYKDHLKPIEKYLSEQKGISVIGRYGAFKYNNQDHSILMGLLAAENILKKTKHNLWELNTDYEYQESSRISSTGLIKSL